MPNGVCGGIDEEGIGFSRLSFPTQSLATLFLGTPAYGFCTRTPNLGDEMAASIDSPSCRLI